MKTKLVKEHLNENNNYRSLNAINIANLYNRLIDLGVKANPPTRSTVNDDDKGYKVVIELNSPITDSVIKAELITDYENLIWIQPTKILISY